MSAPAHSASASATLPRDEAELAVFITERHASARPVQITGGGTRRQAEAVESQDQLSTRALSGIVTYEPGSLTLIARTGTPIEEIETALAAEGQALAFEPMDHRALLGTTGTPTIGGIVAANVSGPRRVQAGACRDYVLGVRFVDGRGRIIKNGGRVMKNVTGLDLGKVMSGAHGTLGVLTEVAFKTLPMAEAQQTLAFPGLTVAAAVKVFSTALGTPFEVSGAAFHGGTAWLRIEGLGPQVNYRRERLTGLFKTHEIETLDDAASRTLWRSLRDVRHLADGNDPVWRILTKPSDAPAIVSALEALGGSCALDWGGGLIWYHGPADAAAVRQAAGAGHAFVVRRAHLPAETIFPTEPRAVADLSRALRKTFDPAGLFNPGLMGN